MSDAVDELYKAEPDFSSVVSYPTRERAWGSGSYRGNCDGRLFLNLLLRYRPRSVADPMCGSGTTRDVVAGLNGRASTPIQYWGADLRTGFDLLRSKLPGTYDFIWVHPPYWNIIEYGHRDGDLSGVLDYAEFLGKLSECLRQAADALNPNGRLAVLVADVRRRGAYYPLGRHIMSLDSSLGELRSVIIKVQHNCRSDWKEYRPIEDPRIRHEYCVVFKRPSGWSPSGRSVGKEANV